MPETGGSQVAQIRVTRTARDALFAAYESIRENSELMATVPARNRPEVNPVLTLNASSPRENTRFSTEVGAGNSQTSPKRTYGQEHSRGGEANKTTESDTGPALAGPYGPYRLWLPHCRFDWSVFHVWDSDGEEETLVGQVSRTVRCEHHCVIQTHSKNTRD